MSWNNDPPYDPSYEEIVGTPEQVTADAKRFVPHLSDMPWYWHPVWGWSQLAWTDVDVDESRDR